VTETPDAEAYDARPLEEKAAEAARMTVTTVSRDEVWRLA
jgi:hypothetical protein